MITITFNSQGTLKSVFIIALLSFLVNISFAQVSFHSKFEAQAFETNDPLQLMIASDPNATYEVYLHHRVELNQLLEKLHSKQKKYKYSSEFLEWTFYYVHRKMLGWYENYVSLNDLFSNKKYDCLTGTILYSIILKDLKIPYTIHEFDYHIFLVVNLPEGDILIESTDPLEGYVKDKKEIDHRVEKYFASTENKTLTRNSHGDQLGVGQIQQAFHGSKSVKRNIDLKKLAGLQYFNLAIKSYNQQQYAEAIQYINKAELLYPGNRMINAKKLMIASQ